MEWRGFTATSMALLRGRGVDRCKWALLDELINRRKKGKVSLVLFIDFSSAYDRVDMRRLEIKST